jgi:hypothetical protein
VSRLGLGPSQLPTQWAPGNLYLAVKQSGCDTGHSPPPYTFTANNVTLLYFTLLYFNNIMSCKTALLWFKSKPSQPTTMKLLFKTRKCSSLSVVLQPHLSDGRNIRAEIHIFKIQCNLYNFRYIPVTTSFPILTKRMLTLFL